MFSGTNWYLWRFSCSRVGSDFGQGCAAVRFRARMGVGRVFVFLVFLKYFSDSVSTRRSGLVCGFGKLSFRPDGSVFVALTLRSGSSVGSITFLSSVFSGGRGCVETNCSRVLFRGVLKTLTREIRFRRGSLTVKARLIARTVGRNMTACRGTETRRGTVRTRGRTRQGTFVRGTGTRGRRGTVRFRGVAGGKSIGDASAPSVCGRGPVGVSSLCATSNSCGTTLRVRTGVRNRTCIERGMGRQEGGTVTRDGGDASVGGPVRCRGIVATIARDQARLCVGVENNCVMNCDENLGRLNGRS